MADILDVREVAGEAILAGETHPTSTLINHLADRHRRCHDTNRSTRR
ncbi:hypothetical protein ACW2Q0_28660 [Nocardia sp. R16R-3T]